MGSTPNSIGISLVENHSSTQQDITNAPGDFTYPSNRLETKLLRDLQSSLDIGEILNIFLKELRTLLPIDGLSYHHTEDQLEYKIGKQGKHQATYYLETDTEKMGQIIFSSRQRFKESGLNIFEDLMSYLFYPIRNALKYQKAVKAAVTDTLTNCGNRIAMKTAILREIQLATRDDTPLAIIMFDFDYFKKVNDTFGHQCGDYILKKIAAEIQNILRKTDLIFRYGGEEFVILLHRTTLEGAKIVAEQIRNHVEKLLLEFKRQTLTVTLSFGATAMKKGDDIESLIKRADESLYMAKHSGRNCVKYII